MRNNLVLTIYKTCVPILSYFNAKKTNRNKEKTALKIHDKIQSALLNPGFLKEFENTENNLSFEQYRLLVESTDKADETRTSINNIFITLNSIFVAFLTQTDSFADFKLEKLIFLGCVLPIAIIICGDWIRIIKSYKQINSINYALLKKLESYMPSNVFSLRSDLLTISEQDGEKANQITRKELLIPIAFLAAYLVYFSMVIYQLKVIFGS